VKDLTKLYDRLTPVERLRAFVEAAGRRDTAEMDRLNDTCPRKTYEMEDYAYTRGKMMFWILALAHHAEAGRYAQCAFFALVVLASEEAAPDVTEPMEKLFEASVRRYRTNFVAWDRFCGETGIAPDAVLSAYGIGDEVSMELALEVADQLGFADPSEEEIDKQLQPLLAIWSDTAR
jgi:hypothetical protein